MIEDSKDPSDLLLELVSAAMEDGSDPFAETGMKLDIRALMTSTIPYEDKDENEDFVDLVKIAKRVLRTGAQGIANGTPSPVFLHYIAHAILKTIDDEKPSLDRALGLMPKAGRKPDPPQKNDPIVAAFDTAMNRFVEGVETPAYGHPGFDELQHRALGEAYKKAYGSYPSQQRAQEINEKSITDRMTKVKRILTERGVYTPHGSKGKKRPK